MLIWLRQPIPSHLCLSLQPRILMDFFEPHKFIERLAAARAQHAEHQPGARPDPALTAPDCGAPSLPVDTVPGLPTASPATPLRRRVAPLGSIAESLKLQRVRRGLTQRQLGDLTGLPQSHISKIESGTVDLRLTSLFEIARVLQLSVRLEPAPPTDQ
jgi:DNA-binding XRE family transcriptional regulator